MTAAKWVICGIFAVICMKVNYNSDILLQSHKSRYLEAVCGVNQDQPATLKVYKESLPNSKDKIIQEIPFTDVKHVDHLEERLGKIVVIKLFEGDSRFCFFADTVTATDEWFRCCGLLFSIPCYVIPEVPKESLVLQKFIDEHDDPQKFNASMWAV